MVGGSGGRGATGGHGSAAQVAEAICTAARLEGRVPQPPLDLPG
jgi:hypothetical protein